MQTLFELIDRLTPGRSAWHEQFKFAVVCDRDGSWWTVDAHGSSAWKYPVRDASEALTVMGVSTAADPGWIVR